jgi:hypothetical protein
MRARFHAANKRREFVRVRLLRGELAQNVDIDHKDELLDRLQRVAVNHALEAGGLGDRVRVALLRVRAL